MDNYVQIKQPKSETVYRLLRDEIIKLSLKPGALIDKAEICERLRVSRFPVSDAISRLGREGLVSVEPQHGSFVARIRLEDILQAGFIRRAIEGEACAWLALNMPDGMLPALDASLEQQAQMLQDEDTQAFAHEDDTFHAILLNALKRPKVMEAVIAAKAHFARVNHLVNPVIQRLELTFNDHRAIVDALHTRNPDAARQAMGRHIDQLTARIHQLAALQPSSFE